MIEPQSGEPNQSRSHLPDQMADAMAAAWRVGQALTRADIWREASTALTQITRLPVACFDADGRELLAPVPGHSLDAAASESVAGVIEAVEAAWFTTSAPSIVTVDQGRAIATACTDADGLRGAIALISEADHTPSPDDAAALALIALATGYALGTLALQAKTVPLLRHEAEIERLRLALSHTLHDGPAQDLAMANMALEHLLSTAATSADPSEDSRLALDYVGRAVGSLRHFISQLREGQPLIERLSASIASPAPVFPDTAQEEAALAIAREALRNCRKHAEAERITITIARDQEGIDFLIADDGRGFFGDERPGHFGLSHMREAADVAGGEFAIESTPGRGTSVRFTSSPQSRQTRERPTRRSAPAKLETRTNDHK